MADQTSLAGTLTGTSRELPDQADQLVKFKDALRQVSTAATAATRPTIGAELDRYAKAGVPLTTPTAINAGLQAGTLGPR